MNGSKYPIIEENELRLTKLEYFTACNTEATVNIIDGISIDTILESLGCPNEIWSFEKHYPKYLAKIQILLAKELLKQLEDESNK